MSDIINAVLDELKGHDVHSVEEVAITVGDLTNLGDDQMEFAFEVMTRDTILSGAKLIIDHEHVRLFCGECNYDGEADILRNEGYDHSVPILSCPRCKGPVKVTEGMACRIRSVRIKEGDDV